MTAMAAREEGLVLPPSLAQALSVERPRLQLDSAVAPLETWLQNSAEWSDEALAVGVLGMAKRAAHHDLVRAKGPVFFPGRR